MLLRKYSRRRTVHLLLVPQSGGQIGSQDLLFEGGLLGVVVEMDCVEVFGNFAPFLGCSAKAPVVPTDKTSILQSTSTIV